MDHAALLSRIRELVAAGHLPGPAEPIRRVRVATLPEAVCAICEGSAPQVAYERADGQTEYLHAACDALRLTIAWIPPVSTPDPVVQPANNMLCWSLGD